MAELGFTVEIVVATALGAVAYGFAMFLTSVAWGVLLKGLTEQPVRWTQIVSAHGRSSIAKYLPGNVFHYAGRQVLGHAMGWPHTAMAAATILETVLIMFVAALLAFLFRLDGEIARADKPDIAHIHVKHEGRRVQPPQCTVKADRLAFERG